MGDAENVIPSSKKRAAGRELSRDNPGLDDEEGASEIETGTFKRASDDVLATRRIVKVRRQPTNSTSSSNPFSSIRLVPPTEPSSNVTAEAQSASEKTVSNDVRDTDAVAKDNEEAKDENGKQPTRKASEADNKTTADEEDAAKKENTADKEDAVEKTTAVEEDAVDKEIAHKNVAEKSSAAKETDPANGTSKAEVDGEQTNDEDTKENKAESEEPNTDGVPLKSFQQLSSTQNAFTGLVGTGFSSSSFSFGSISKEGSTLGSGSTFGLGLSNNGNSSVFGVSGVSAVSKGEGNGFPTMQEVPVETGEENERAVFTADSVLYEFVDGTWKERGKGELKVNVTATEENKARLLMRARGNFRLILNASLYPEMKLTNMDKRGITFACVNSASEGKDSLSTFALKFKDGSLVEEFRAAVNAHKGNTSTVLRTPENSPKASED